MKSTDARCTCCDKRLRGEPVFLELVEGTDDFYRKGVPAGKRSQGWFPFGKTCAKKKAIEDVAEASVRKLRRMSTRRANAIFDAELNDTDPRNGLHDCDQGYMCCDGCRHVGHVRDLPANHADDESGVAGSLSRRKANREGEGSTPSISACA